MIYHLTEFAARLEKRHAALAHIDGGSGLGVAARARFSHPHFEAAESAYLDAVVFDERVRHAVKDRVDYDFHVACRKIWKSFAYCFDQIALIQGPLLFVSRES